MVLILSNLRSLHNVGSIFRTADAAGIGKLYLAGITPAPVDYFGKPRQQLTKVSLGAEKSVVWEKTASVSKLINRLQKDGYKVFAIEQSKNSIPYYSLTAKRYNPQRLALIFGNEVSGLSPAILKKCDKILEIPMRGKKESLNVAVACGIVVFYLIDCR